MRHYKKKNYLFILPNTKVNKKIFLRFYSTNTLLKYKKYFIKKTEIKKNIKLKNRFKNFFTIKTKIISNNLNLNSELDLLIK